MTDVSESLHPEKSPVVLFVYNRVDTTEKVLDAILRYCPPKLYIVADGPNQLKPRDRDKVNSVRRLVEGIEFPFPVIKDYSDANLGLAQRFTSGLSRVFESEKQAIILEDDCLPAQSFFRFCSEMLFDFEQDDSVGVVSGNNFCQSRWPSRFDFEVAVMPRTWGWATWDRVWKDFDISLPKFELDQAAKLGTEVFSSPRLGRKWARTIQSSLGSRTIWDHQFAYWLIASGKLSIYPRRNLVKNIGFGVEATHTVFDSFASQLDATELDFPLQKPGSLGLTYDFIRLEKLEKRQAWLKFAVEHPIELALRLLRYLSEKTRRRFAKS